MTYDRLDRLIDALSDPDHDLRIEAAVELGTLRDPRAAQALVERLGTEPEFSVRESLSWAVLRVVDAALPALEDALTSDRWLARLQATHVLSKLARPEDGPRLRPLVADPVDAVAARAWWAAGQSGDPSVVPALAAQLGRGTTEQRSVLTSALAGFGSAAVAPTAEALRSADPGVRLAAVRVATHLGALAQPAALDLIDLVSDADADVRFEAVAALENLRGPLVERALADASASDDRAVAALARRLRERRVAEVAPAPTDLTETAQLRWLRSQTDAGLARCRQALTEAGGDLAAARDSLLHKAVGAGETAVRVAVSGNAAVELRCGSAVVAGTRTLARLADDLAELAAAGADREAVLATDINGRPVADVLADLAATTGAPVELVRVVRVPGRVASATTVEAGVPVAAALIGYATEEALGDEVAHQVAQQVAFRAPRWIEPQDVPGDVLGGVAARAEADARTSGRPEAVVERLSAGAVAGFLADHVLTAQACVADPGFVVGDLLATRRVSLLGVERVG
ncbi:HEAT repeat domain-containing protein [Mariniluteicoccus flavus]